MMDAAELVGYLTALRQASTDEIGNLDWDDFYSAVSVVINGTHDDRQAQSVAIRFLSQTLLEYGCSNFVIIMNILRSLESPFYARGYDDAFRVMFLEGNYWEFLFRYFPGIHRFLRALCFPDVRLARAQVIYGWYLDIELLWSARDFILTTVLSLWSHEERTYNMDYLAALRPTRYFKLLIFCAAPPDNRETNRRLFRIFLIVFMLEEVAWRRRRREIFAMKSYRQCVLLLFRATPEPHVTVREVQLFLRFMLREEDYDAVAGDLIPRISMILPNGTRVRTLSDLARCSVRRAIMRSGPYVFPDAVGTLRIPRYFQNIIIGD